MNNKGQTLKETFSQALQSYKKKNYKNAEFLCYKIINIDPNHVDSLSLLATICAFHKDYIKAKELMEKAVEIQPENIIFLGNLGTANKELGNLEEAINIYKKALY